MRVRRAIGREGHVIEQEAQTIVAESQLQLVIAISFHLVEQRDDPVFAEILAAAVEVQDLIIIRVVRRARLAVTRREGRDGQQAHHHDHRENQRQHFLAQRSCLRLIHVFHPFPICEFPFALQGPRSPPPRILSGILIQNLF